MNSIIKQYEYLDGRKDYSYRLTKGARGTAEAIGIIVLNSCIPCPPGHVSNGWTFDFPVHYERADEADLEAVVERGEMDIVQNIIDTAKKLELDGCRAICADCGYFGRYQDIVADSVSVPVYMSSIIQIPMIAVGLKKDQKIGMICANANTMSKEVFRSCGVSDELWEKVVIEGASDGPEFKKILNDSGMFDGSKVKEELLCIALKLQHEHPDIGAILLECTDMPPYAFAIQAATNLPVFDMTTFIRYIADTVTQRPYSGFIG